MKYMIGISIAVAAVLLAVIVWQRGDVIKAKAEAKSYAESAERYRQANETNLQTVQTYKKASAANKILAESYAARLAVIANLDEGDKTKIREVLRNDPVANAWADTVVPDSLRDAANRH